MIPVKSTLDVLISVAANLASAWFAIIFVTPQFLSDSKRGFQSELIVNISFGIVSLIIAIVLAERRKKYER